MRKNQLSSDDHDLLTQKLGYVQGVLSLLYGAVNTKGDFEKDGIEWVIIKAQERLNDALSCIKGMDV